MCGEEELLPLFEALVHQVTSACLFASRDLSFLICQMSMIILVPPILCNVEERTYLQKQDLVG